MIAAPAICVHDLPQARAALEAAHALNRAVILVSAPAAAGFGGCGWWQALMRAAAGDALDEANLLDCGDAAGYAMGALRIGLRGIILDPETPALLAVRGAAGVLGATVLTARPACLDLSERGAERRLKNWLMTHQ